MLKEPKLKELTREDIYAEYFSRLEDVDNRNINEDFYNKIKEANEIFKGKTKLEVLIKGTVKFDKDYQKLFTFFNKTYEVTKKGLENCLLDLDKFEYFMEGDSVKVHYFSEVENEYVNYTRVLNAHIYMELT